MMMMMKKQTLHYFDMEKPIYIFTDAHVSGIGSILAQGENTSAQPVTFALQTTNAAKKKYPQLDLEAMAVDFGLRRYINYILGAPEELLL